MNASYQLVTRSCSSSRAGRSRPGVSRGSFSCPSSNSRVCWPTVARFSVAAAISSQKTWTAGSAPFAPSTGSSRSSRVRASRTAASSDIGIRYAGYSPNGAVRMAVATTLLASTKAANQHGTPSGHGTAGRRWSRMREATPAITVLSTGCSARCAPATSRNSAGSS